MSAREQNDEVGLMSNPKQLGHFIVESTHNKGGNCKFVTKIFKNFSIEANAFIY